MKSIIIKVSADKIVGLDPKKEYNVVRENNISYVVLGEDGLMYAVNRRDATVVEEFKVRKYTKVIGVRYSYEVDTMGRIRTKTQGKMYLFKCTQEMYDTLKVDDDLLISCATGLQIVMVADLNPSVDLYRFIDLEELKPVLSKVELDDYWNVKQTETRARDIKITLEKLRKTNAEKAIEDYMCREVPGYAALSEELKFLENRK